MIYKIFLKGVDLFQVLTDWWAYSNLDYHHIYSDEKVIKNDI